MGAVASAPCCTGAGGVVVAEVEGDNHVVKDFGPTKATDNRYKCVTITRPAPLIAVDDRAGEAKTGQTSAAGDGGGACSGGSPACEDLKSPQSDTTTGCESQTTLETEGSGADAPPAEVFTASFDRRRSAKQLGLDFRPALGGRALVITRISAGLAKDYNSSNKNKNQPIRVGDLVYEINGAKDHALALIDQCRTSAKLELVLGRPEG
mmetsp:Transcript_41645/g.120822  ORF Transcript_41645/g.120822 Transcript_41645/m.120822 type:complete len:208 (-) Transcript_41645:74-697(-)